MLSKTDILKILQTYNISSSSYGPTIYENNNTLGICLDIKDSTFGFLTRIFTFNDLNTLDEFLQKLTWYKNNHQKYSIKLKLDDYQVKEAHIKYMYQNEELTLNDMLNLEKNLETKKETIINNDYKNAYLLNIEYLTKYLITLKNNNYNLKNEKNNLKIKENDLKYELLENLTTYYGKAKTIEKKAVSLENINNPSTDINLLETNLNNIKTKEKEEIENYLKILINLTKEEELNEKNLINIYSNNIYRYNIEILNKQIEFVKSKINAEKNFNLKGSKIHNIDEELKSFLNTKQAPEKINTFLNKEITKINNKYNQITDITKSYSIISGNPLNIPDNTIKNNNLNTLEDLNNKFKNLDNNTKSSLILYNSIYKNICNYIIDNNYPEINTIKEAFDFTYYYNELDEIIHNEHNNHYLINYFSNINFKTIDTYINSLIEIAKVVENTKFLTINNLKVFSLNKTTKYKELTTIPMFSKELTYIIDLNSNTEVLYIPTKIEIDEITNELNISSIPTIYYKGLIINTNNTITVNKYNKINHKDLNNAIIITNELTLNSSTIFYEGTLKGE